jgi:hypothetical protein
MFGQKEFREMAHGRAKGRLEDNTKKDQIT